MKCLILAAGYATRLYPLTERFPKPLLPVGGKAILDWLVDDLETTGGIDEYIVVSNHKFFAHFIAWAKRRPQKITVLDDGSTENENRLGAVRDVAFAVETLDLRDDLLVIAGDNLLDFRLADFLVYAKEKGTSCVMRYYEPDEQKLRRCGVLAVDEGDLVLSMTEKSPAPATHWCCPPFYFFIREDAARVSSGIAAGCGTDAPGSYVAWLCGQTAVHAMEMTGKRYDVGTLESYEKIKNEYRGISPS